MYPVFALHTSMGRNNGLDPTQLYARDVFIWTALPSTSWWCRAVVSPQSSGQKKCVPEPRFGLKLRYRNRDQCGSSSAELAASLPVRSLAVQHTGRRKNMITAVLGSA